jgi:O-antigen ligase
MTTLEYLRRNSLKDMPMRMAFVGFVLYVLAITTYIANIGTIAMAIGLIGLVAAGVRIALPTPLVMLALLWLWSLFSTVLSTYSGDLDTLWTVGKVLLIFWVSLNALRSAAATNIFVLLYVGAFVLFPARGTIFNYFIYHNADFGRASWRDSFGNPNDVAALVLLALAVAAGLLHRTMPKLIRMGGGLACAVFAFVVLLTQSRAGFIGLSLFTLLAVATQRRNRVRALVLLIVAAAVVVAIAPTDVWQRIAGLRYAGSTQTIAEMDPEGSAEQRWAIWQTGARIIKGNPVMGVGLGRYPAANARYSPELGARDVHSTFLSILAETGIPGFCLFLLMIGSCVVAGRRARARCRDSADNAEWRRLQLMEYGLYGYLAAGLWGTFGLLSHFYVFLAILYVQADVLTQDSQDTPKTKSSLPSKPAKTHAATYPRFKGAKRLLHRVDISGQQHPVRA